LRNARKWHSPPDPPSEFFHSAHTQSVILQCQVIEYQCMCMCMRLCVVADVVNGTMCSMVTFSTEVRTVLFLLGRSRSKQSTSFVSTRAMGCFSADDKSDTKETRRHLRREHLQTTGRLRITRCTQGNTHVICISRTIKWLRSSHKPDSCKVWASSSVTNVHLSSVRTSTSSWTQKACLSMIRSSTCS
jgi:hypothetical protein